MKLTYFILLLCTVVETNSCPNLSGVYHCSQQVYQDMILSEAYDLNISQNNNTYLLSTSDEEGVESIIADGISRMSYEVVETGELITVDCKDNQLVKTLEESMVNVVDTDLTKIISTIVTTKNQNGLQTETSTHLYFKNGNEKIIEDKSICLNK